MKKKNIIFLLIALMTIGFASISTNVFLNIKSSIAFNYEDFKVTLEDVVSENGNIIASENDFSIDEAAKVSYTIVNDSTEYDVLAKITCNTFESDEYYIEAQNILTETITLTAKDNCKLKVTALERTKKNNNLKLCSIKINGKEIDNFKSYIRKYENILEDSSIDITAESCDNVKITGTGIKFLNWGNNVVTIKTENSLNESITYDINFKRIKPTEPEVSGGSTSWLSSSQTLNISKEGEAPSGIKYYEYYKSTDSKTPTDVTEATGTTTNNLTVTDNGINYIWYRTVSNLENKSGWSIPQTVKIDSVDPTAAINATNHCSLQTSVLSGNTTNDKLRFKITSTSNNLSGNAIYYCKDTSNTCNPTTTYSKNLLIFATNTYYVRYKIVSGAGKSSNIYSYKAVINDTRKCPINLIYNGSFEYGSSGWSGWKFDIVNNGSNGSKSLRFNHDNGNDYTSMTIQEMPVPLLNHKYYGSLKFKSSSNFSSRDTRFEYYTNDTGIGHIEFARKDIKVNDWTKMSAIGLITDSTYLNTNWVVRNFQRGANGYSYADEVLMVDLTMIYGSGSEPSIDWGDTYITYTNLINESEPFEIIY